VREICTPGSEWGDGYKVPCRLGEATDSKGQQWQGSAKAKAPRPIPTSQTCWHDRLTIRRIAMWAGACETVSKISEF
jgi:hypothetical protein